VRMLPPMKIAVLGATGMIGNHCVRAALDRGHAVRVVHRAKSDLRHLAGLDFEPRVADLDDEPALRAALKGVDAIIHAAGYYPPGVPRGHGEERDLARAQMERFFHACHWDRLERVVFIGSVVAVPADPHGRPATGDASYPGPPRSKIPYLHVKYELDRLAREKGQAGFPVVVAVPGMCLGEYDKGPTTGKLVVAIANRELPAFVRGKRNVVYTGDAARGMVLACERGTPGKRYLLTGTNIELRDLVARIASAARVPAPSIGIPAPIAKIVAAALEAKHRRLGGKEPLLTSTAIAVSSGQFLDGSSTARELDFRAEVGLDDTIGRALGWFRSVGYVR
jgi:dihydroflavonol-4-reductase